MLVKIGTSLLLIYMTTVTTDDEFEILTENDVSYVEVEWDTPPSTPKNTEVDCHEQENLKQLSEAINKALAPKAEVVDTPKRNRRVHTGF